MVRTEHNRWNAHMHTKLEMVQSVDCPFGEEDGKTTMLSKSYKKLLKGNNKVPAGFHVGVIIIKRKNLHTSNPP